jgi:peptidoglycan L-alanyl-D-glutamate endopeptidase CwlK
MSRALNDLAPTFRTIAFEVVARCAEAGIPVMIVETLRTPAQHALNLANNVSWTEHSRHLDGLAIDLCPYLQYDLHGPDKLQWDNADPAWQTIGAIGERLGLRWGGRWRQKDMGHLEFVPKKV